MKQLDEQTLVSMSAMRHHAPVEKFLKWLEESLSEEREANDTREGVALHRGQGAAITLNEIITTVRQAPKILDRVHGTPRQTAAGME